MYLREMGNFTECDFLPSGFSDDACKKWMCAYYDCSENGGPSEPRCKCNCRVDIIWCFVACGFYLFVCICCWTYKAHKISRIASSVAFLLASVSLCVALFTDFCNVFVLLSVLELMVFPFCGFYLCLKGYCGCRRGVYSSNSVESLPQDVRLQTEDVPQVTANDTDPPPMMAILPDGEVQLAIIVTKEESE